MKQRPPHAVIAALIISVAHVVQLGIESSKEFNLPAFPSSVDSLFHWLFLSSLTILCVHALKILLLVNIALSDRLLRALSYGAHFIDVAVVGILSWSGQLIKFLLRLWRSKSIVAIEMLLAWLKSGAL